MASLQKQAHDLFLTGVRAADPTIAVRNALIKRPLTRAPEGTLFLIAFGKAACAMMEEALRHIPTGQRHDALTGVGSGWGRNHTLRAYEPKFSSDREEC
ncbi:DUF4147 domain-containing protein [Roseibium sp. TrichSKD4]|uniref:DUF4147 domain-containing protein n=1 Tax=Roseibium sp. TrichSKD4 TaxID=744980 RepID=UPI00143AFBA4|nr:DUF4147 domain-containing protein [Roseibium sp. TrichSKD4]